MIKQSKITILKKEVVKEERIRYEKRDGVSYRSVFTNGENGCDIEKEKTDKEKGECLRFGEKKKESETPISRRTLSIFKKSQEW